MRLVRRSAAVAVATVTILTVGAGSALAHECVNPDKKAGAGAQVLIDLTNEDAPPVFLTKGIQQRFESGVTTQDTFRGLIGFDMDGDGTADLTTWIVGKYGEIPLKAQLSGAECHGVINIGTYFEVCMQQG
ncbi:MAG TPA: hypothetical protein VFO98_11665 [Marmoricola sp.]|jgi:hypothetical protein|nr:hypothetical protein [Marmoricola sp.]